MKEKALKIDKNKLDDILRYRSMLRTVYKKSYSIEHAATVWKDFNSRQDPD